jgi:hypothetical protein
MRFSLAHGLALRIGTGSSALAYFSGSTKRLSLVSLTLLFIEFQLTRRV